MEFLENSKIMDPKEYKKHIAYEKKFYNLKDFRDDLTEQANPGLQYILDAFQKRVEAKIGKNVWDYTIKIVNEKGKTNPVKILSVGSGPGGTEMNLAKKFKVEYTMDCIDINENLIKIGQNKADKMGLSLNFSSQDINQLTLKEDEYDVVFAHAALHHMINHEHVSREIKKTMRKDAVFIVYDVTARNGLRLWDETKKIANEVWAKIPLKYRYNPIEDKFDEYAMELPDKDLSEGGFECIRSQDLLPILKKEFHVEIEVSGFSFARRFVENPYGYNYDPGKNYFDKNILDTIIALDEKYSESNNLKPESVFLVLKNE